MEPTVSASPTYQSTKQQISGGRALYNGTQQYDPQQYDPYYALYDDDVELYKDAGKFYSYILYLNLNQTLQFSVCFNFERNVNT